MTIQRALLIAALLIWQPAMADQKSEDLPELFGKLQQAESSKQAILIETEIWKKWYERDEDDGGKNMSNAIALLIFLPPSSSSRSYHFFQISVSIRIACLELSACCSLPNSSGKSSDFWSAIAGCQISNAAISKARCIVIITFSPQNNS